jgi:hypothetical protein
MGSSDLWGCAPVHSKLIHKIVFSNRNLTVAAVALTFHNEKDILPPADGQQLKNRIRVIACTMASWAGLTSGHSFFIEENKHD